MLRFRKEICIILIALTGFTSLGYAQNTIYGKLISGKDNEPLMGATVLVEGTTLGAKTDLDGNYSIQNIPDGTYNILCRYVSFETKRVENVELKGGGSQKLDVTLSQKTNAVKEVVIQSSVMKESTNSLIALQRKSKTLSSGISSDLIQKSPDRDVSDVLKRASGMSVVGGKYAVVRGMEGRYISTMINGILIPSTEPDKKAFSFDLIPANIIDNITITKAALPEYTAEFAGGIIDVQLKDNAEKSFVNLSLGLGGNSITTGKTFYYYQGGKTDYIGKDDGTRTLPEAFPSTYELKNYRASDTANLFAATKLLNPDWSYHSRNAALPNMSLQVNGGFTKKIKKDELDILASLSYNKNNIHQAQRTRNTDYLNGEGDIQYTFQDDSYSENVLLGGLLNLTYKINGKHKIYFKNLYNGNATDRVTLREGEHKNQGYLRSHELFYVQNSLINSQLGAYHVLPANIKLYWNANYSKIDQLTPDRRIMQYKRTSEEDNTWVASIPNSATPKLFGRFFSDLNEKVYSGKLDLKKDFDVKGSKQTIKIGGYYQDRERDFWARNIGMKKTNIVKFDNGKLNLPMDQIFNPENISLDGFTITENTNGTDMYAGTANQRAGYIQMDNSFMDKFRLSWGLRVEDYTQRLFNSIEMQDTIMSNHNTNILPSAVFTYSPNENNNLRLCYSQTIVRPEFRELAPFGFYDFANSVDVSGNPDLKPTLIHNYDIRYEYYPHPGEQITGGVFYKQFNNAIQTKNIDQSGGDVPALNFVNAEKAFNLGAEVEFRKALLNVFKTGSLHRIFRHVTAFANFTYIYSKVVESDTGLINGQARPLVGQSPTLINLGLTYQNPDNGWGASALLYRYGRRLFLPGSFEDNLPDIWEASRTKIDFQVSKKLGKKSEIRMNVSDVLNQKNIFYQDIDGNKKYSGEDKDFMFYDRTLGFGFGIKYSYKLFD